MHTLERVKTWQLVMLLILSLFMTASFLRLNNIGMIERREAVYSADTAGDDYVTADRLYDLQRYASNHMNANTGDVYLDKKYQRDVEAIVREAEEANSESSARSAALLEQAYQVCRDRYPGYSTAYTLCVSSEQAKIPANEIDVARAEFPSPALYRYNFISPLWSPDFAGWFTLASIVLAILIVLRVIAGIVLHLLLKRRYRSI